MDDPLSRADSGQAVMRGAAAPRRCCFACLPSLRPLLLFVHSGSETRLSDQVEFSLPEALTYWIVAAVVADPIRAERALRADGDRPELKIVATPAGAFADATVALCGLLDASAASVTVGAGLGGLQVNWLKTLTVHR